MSDLAAARAACRTGWFEPLRIETLNAGRINDSYRVVDPQTAREGVLQAINARVFTQAVQLVEQLERVVSHLNSQLPGWVPELLPTLEGSCYVHCDGRVWRLWRFVQGEALQLEHCPRPLRLARLRAAGEAFARTQVLLETLPGPRLVPAIGHYHDLAYYLERFDALAEQATPQWRGRVERFREQPFQALAADGYIHGDCKPDNLLFHAQRADVAAVLDLDTIMWGSRALDFGDLVRSSVWSEARFDSDAFDALLSGFVSGQRYSAAPCAASQLAAAPLYVSFMLSLRYLIDHLQGDVEFKVDARGDNLARADARYQRTVALAEAQPIIETAITRVHGAPL